MLHCRTPALAREQRALLVVRVGRAIRRRESRVDSGGSLRSNRRVVSTSAVAGSGSTAVTRARAESRRGDSRSSPSEKSSDDLLPALTAPMDPLSHSGTLYTLS